MESEDLLSVLSRNLPDDPHDYIFGKAADASADDAKIQAEKRSAPKISVYVVSTNAGQESLLSKIWSTVPSRFVVMKGDDFFKKEEGRYDTMGEFGVYESLSRGETRHHRSNCPYLAPKGPTGSRLSQVQCISMDTPRSSSTAARLPPTRPRTATGRYWEGALDREYRASSALSRRTRRRCRRLPQRRVSLEYFLPKDV